MSGLSSVLMAALFVPAIVPESKPSAAPGQTGLNFEVTLAKGLLKGPQDGRLLVVLGQAKDLEPREMIGSTSMDAAPILGRDVKAFAVGSKVVVDQSAMIFPLSHLSQLSEGQYFAQVLFDYHPDLRLPNAPGNVCSAPVSFVFDPAKPRTVQLELSRKVPDEEIPAETEYVKYVKLRSELLSRFHGRPIYLRAGVILPRDFDKDKDRRYPLRVRIGGFGTRFTRVDDMMGRFASFRESWLADAAPRMVLLHLDGAGPLGDPYQVNSANNGPFGDAITQELIPHVEKKYRGIGQPYARVLDGSSTGGWVSLALQVFYPDFFQGAWSHAPDPVDFRAYELINIYEDTNAYINARRFERPAARELNGDVRYTVRHECHLERVLGRGDRWELSGRDWCSWNATFGPRGADGLPVPLWDGRTGKIDRAVLEHWKRYDLRLVLEKNWPVLGPKLRGKIHIWVGEADDYYLNNAVHLLDDFLRRAKPAADSNIVYGPGQGHGWTGLGEEDMMKQMADAIARGKR
jgi:Putative esterase